MTPSQSEALRTSQQVIANTNKEKLFIGDNTFQKGNLLNNSSYNNLVIPMGTVVGRIGETGTLVPLSHNSNDGSQHPVGVLAHDVELDAAETQSNVTICDGGEVAEELLTFNSGTATTLESVVTNPSGQNRRVRDLLQDQGIKLRTRTHMTNYDNQ